MIMSVNTEKISGCAQTRMLSIRIALASVKPLFSEKKTKVQLNDTWTDITACLHASYNRSCVVLHSMISGQLSKA